MSTYCRAVINYVEGTELCPVESDIGDGRAAPLSWVENGFELRELPSAVDDWTDPHQVVERHHPEVIDFVTGEVGCDAVLFYPGIIRAPKLADTTEDDLGPIEVAHSDYTESYRAMLAKPDHPYLDILAPSMRVAGVAPADLAAATRVLTLQLWRNIGPTRPDRPLALCDATTVDRDELTPYFVESYAGIPTEFDSFLLKPPTDDRARRWLTFPAMESDEVLLFRAFDSDRVAGDEPFWTPHTAFVDPTVGPDAPGRRSIELRAVCLFLA